MRNRPALTHIAGNFLIETSASFLNGAGLGEGEDRNVSVVKTFKDGKDKVPYVSSQAWKRWLRNTMIEETGWKPSILRALHVNAKGNTDKIGGEFNPVDYAEDDIFGYMRTEKGSSNAAGNNNNAIEAETDEEDEAEEEAKSKIGTVAKGNKKVKALTRTSPFSASILVSIRKSGWQGRDEAFVHLKEGTPQPYTTEFYNTHLQGVFCLNYSRLGVFSNIGDRIELDESTIDGLLKSNKIIVKQENGNVGKVYELADAAKLRRERAGALLRSLAVLRGGAKQAAFGTDVSPKAIVLAGLASGNPVFNGLFKDEAAGGPILKIETLKEIARDYAIRLSTPVFVGIRKGYLKNENDVSALNGSEINGVKITVTTPIEAADLMAKQLLL
jgi:CRISPR-associated protein Cst2